MKTIFEMADFAFEFMFEMPDIILIWTGRISIILLTVLTFIYFRRRRDKISLLLLIGMIFIFISETANYLANALLFREENLETLRNIAIVTRYIAILGYIFSIVGCYLNVFRQKSA